MHWCSWNIRSCMTGHMCLLNCYLSYRVIHRLFTSFRWTIFHHICCYSSRRQRRSSSEKAVSQTSCVLLSDFDTFSLKWSNSLDDTQLVWDKSFPDKPRRRLEDNGRRVGRHHFTWQGSRVTLKCYSFWSQAGRILTSLIAVDTPISIAATYRHLQSRCWAVIQAELTRRGAIKLNEAGCSI